MKPNAYDELIRIKPGDLVELHSGSNRLALCPDLGGRNFAEVGGQCAHRIDLICVAHPMRAFNNFGGANFWPAPEGGPLGFNYHDDQWYVQPSINNQPFELVRADLAGATIQKRVILRNRAGT